MLKYAIELIQTKLKRGIHSFDLARSLFTVHFLLFSGGHPCICKVLTFARSLLLVQPPRLALGLSKSPLCILRSESLLPRYLPG
jgi:hypothetical protein